MIVLKVNNFMTLPLCIQFLQLLLKNKNKNLILMKLKMNKKYFSLLKL